MSAVEQSAEAASPFSVIKLVTSPTLLAQYPGGTVGDATAERARDVSPTEVGRFFIV